MKCGDYESPAFVATSLHNAPYNSSLASSASASSTSVWSDTSSQHSDDTSITVPTSELDESIWSKQQQQQQTLASMEVVPELRQNPRRSSHSATSRTGCPPPLVRQADRKVNFVDNLVGKTNSKLEFLRKWKPFYFNTP